MFKRKFMLGTTAGLIGALAIAGAAFADEGSPGFHPADSVKDRVAEILGIDREDLDSAMSTAREEQREVKQDERLAALVEAGTITQAQADEIDAWEDTRPEVMNELKKLGRGHGTPDDNSIEGRLTALVEQEVITQAEADEIIAWMEAKPDYLDDLRAEMRGAKGHDGEREGRRGRHPHSRHHRGGPQHGGTHGFGQQGAEAPDSGTGTSFTFPDGSKVNF
ncbi:MAG TPA: hypothetical protein EYQ61_00520 [Dehalococcoidia bacterium]|jgi:hypothetical protein|nr:hypothetical protein [Dehalococcoidia bacterium]